MDYRHLSQCEYDDWNGYLFYTYVYPLSSSVRRDTDHISAASILNRAGSIGLALIIWFIGFIMAASGFSVYLELASYFPNRSGSEVVYLEQAYPRPKHFFPVTFAVQSVILSFSSSNAVGKLQRFLSFISYSNTH
jgi:amino acid transporter